MSKNNTIEQSRKIIIDGLQELQDACNRVSTEFCHAKCPYEDICLKLKCVGTGVGRKIQPCDWKLDELAEQNNGQ